MRQSEKKEEIWNSCCTQKNLKKEWVDAFQGTQTGLEVPVLHNVAE